MKRTWALLHIHQFVGELILIGHLQNLEARIRGGEHLYWLRGSAPQLARIDDPQLVSLDSFQEERA